MHKDEYILVAFDDDEVKIIGINDEIKKGRSLRILDGQKVTALNLAPNNKSLVIGYENGVFV